MATKTVGATSSEFLLPFEASFDAYVSLHHVDSIKTVSVYASVIYVLLLFVGRRVMDSRSPYVLRLPLTVWNVTLALFSIVGAIRTVPVLTHVIANHGLSYSVCKDMTYVHGPRGIWAYLFTLSKLIELGDTAFIVLRKQPLQFLHWYHHITVLMYCFYSFPQEVASGSWYMVMNYCVHSTMYSYYALKSMRVRVPRRISIVVTTLQIAQMFVGLAVALSVGALNFTGAACLQTNLNVGITVAMYISYFVLFIHFFYNAYARPTRGGKSKVEANGVGDHLSNGIKKSQ